MKRRHSGEFETCLYCRWLNNQDMETDTPKRKVTHSKHNSAVNRRLRDQVRRDMGLKKVRGALGGIYWE